MCIMIPMSKVKIRINPDTYELLIRAKGQLMATSGYKIENDEVVKKALLRLLGENHDR